MSTDRDVTRIVRSWLEEGVTKLPDRVLDSVLDQLPATHQRRVTWWPVRRTPTMNQAMRIALATAAVVAVALIGLTFFRSANLGGPDLSAPAGTPVPTPTSLPQALVDGPLEAGTYVTTPFPPPDDAIQFTFTVPDGWTGDLRGPAVFPSSGDGPSGPAGAAMSLLRDVGLYADPCHGNAGEPDVQVGPTVDDLVTALANHGAYESSAATDVVMDGFAGKQIELQLPSDIDFATCDGGQFWVWDSAPYAQGPGNRWNLRILDVEGTRVVILAEDFADTPAGIQSELDAIVDSIRIDSP